MYSRNGRTIEICTLDLLPRVADLGPESYLTCYDVSGLEFVDGNILFGVLSE